MTIVLLNEILHRRFHVVGNPRHVGLLNVTIACTRLDEKILPVVARRVQAIFIHFSSEFVPVVVAWFLHDTIKEVKDRSDQKLFGRLTLITRRLMEMVKEILEFHISQHPEPSSICLTDLLQRSVFEAENELLLVIRLIRRYTGFLGHLPQDSVWGQNGLRRRSRLCLRHHKPSTFSGRLFGLRSSTRLATTVTGATG